MKTLVLIFIGLICFYSGFSSGQDTNSSIETSTLNFKHDFFIQQIQNNCGNPTIKPMRRIVGGHESIPHSFPWQLYITDKKYLCGAALISNEWIATAAHCVSLMNTTILKATFGAHNLYLDENTVLTRGISKIFKHPKFNSDSFYHYDIALVKLASPVQFTAAISSICLQTELINFDSAIITGWGITNNANESRKLLRQVRLDILDPVNCPIRSDNLICAGNREITKGIMFYKIRDSCQGDSGGPMIVENNNRYYLVGITSWGIAGCTGTSGYTKVYNFRDWIKTTLYEN